MFSHTRTRKIVESLNDTFGNNLSGEPCDFHGLLDEVIDNDSVASDSSECQDEQSAELLAEIESRSEALIEEFLELAFIEKHERTEQLKSTFRKSAVITKDDQSAQIRSLQQQMDAKRKTGVKQIKTKLQALTSDESKSL